MWILLATSEVKMEVAGLKFVHNRRVTWKPLYADASSAFGGLEDRSRYPIDFTIEIRC